MFPYYKSKFCGHNVIQNAHLIDESLFRTPKSKKNILLPVLHKIFSIFFAAAHVHHYFENNNGSTLNKLKFIYIFHIS